MDDIDEEGDAPDAPLETDSHGLTDYKVGYGKPPLERRFKLNQSNNRRGRPRGSKNRKTIVKEIANEMHTVLEDGQRRQRSTLELMLLALRNLAADGNVPAFRKYEKYLAKFEPQDTSSKGGYLVVPARLTEDEYIRHSEAKIPEQDALHEARMKEFENMS